jgi:hypothetical protein
MVATARRELITEKVILRRAFIYCQASWSFCYPLFVRVLAARGSDSYHVPEHRVVKPMVSSPVLGGDKGHLFKNRHPMLFFARLPDNSMTSSGNGLARLSVEPAIKKLDTAR